MLLLAARVSVPALTRERRFHRNSVNTGPSTKRSACNAGHRVLLRTFSPRPFYRSAHPIVYLLFTCASLQTTTAGKRIASEPRSVGGGVNPCRSFVRQAAARRPDGEKTIGLPTRDRLKRPMNASAQTKQILGQLAAATMNFLAMGLRVCIYEVPSRLHVVLPSRSKSGGERAGWHRSGFGDSRRPPTSVAIVYCIVELRID